MWKSFENIGLQTSKKVSWKKKKHAQNIRSTVHRTGDQTNVKENGKHITAVTDTGKGWLVGVGENLVALEKNKVTSHPHCESKNNTLDF